MCGHPRRHETITGNPLFKHLTNSATTFNPLRNEIHEKFSGDAVSPRSRTIHNEFEAAYLSGLSSEILDSVRRSQLWNNERHTYCEIYFASYLFIRYLIVNAHPKITG